MARIGVFGASGVVGQFLLPQLIAQGDQVLGISRDPARVQCAPGMQWLRGDLCGAAPALPALDVLYSLGPLDAFAQWFAQHAPAALSRVVALSSMSAQSKRESPDAAERALALRLHDAETTLFAAAHTRGIAATVLRPTLIYGTGRDRSLAPIARMARRWRILPIPRGATGLRQPVHAADLAEACLRVRDVAATFGKVYALGGGERLRFDALLARIAAGPPRLALPLPVPQALLRAAAVLARGRIGAGAWTRLTLPLIADNAPAQRDFGYAPRAFVAADVLGGSQPNPLPRRAS